MHSVDLIMLTVTFYICLVKLSLNLELLMCIVMFRNCIGIS